MIEYIKGELTEVTPAYAVVEAHGVGYGLNISLNTYSGICHLGRHEGAGAFARYGGEEGEHNNIRSAARRVQGGHLQA